MLMKDERNQIVEYGKKMSSAGLCKGTAGNLSIYDPDTGYMAISPSGIGYFETTPEDIVIMNLNGEIVEGTRKPSSEYGMHIGFYKAKPGIRAVVHTHSLYCTTLACMHLPISPVHYCIASAGVSTIPCAPYVTFGTPELAEKAVAACGESKAVLLANHGMLAVGSSLADAFGLAENTEFVAELQWRTMCAGGPKVLSSEDMDKVMERFKTYGQKKTS